MFLVRVVSEIFLKIGYRIEFEVLYVVKGLVIKFFIWDRNEKNFLCGFFYWVGEIMMFFVKSNDLFLCVGNFGFFITFNCFSQFL